MKPDIRKMASETDLISGKPASQPVEGHPIGNGRMGMLVWTTPEAAHIRRRPDMNSIGNYAMFTKGASTQILWKRPKKWRELDEN